MLRCDNIYECLWPEAKLYLLHYLSVICSPSKLEEIGI